MPIGRRQDIYRKQRIHIAAIDALGAMPIKMEIPATDAGIAFGDLLISGYKKPNPSTAGLSILVEALLIPGRCGLRPTPAAIGSAFNLLETARSIRCFGEVSRVTVAEHAGGPYFALADERRYAA